MSLYFLNGVRVFSEVPLPCNKINEELICNGLSLEIKYGGKQIGSIPAFSWLAQRPWSRCYDVGDGFLICALSDFQMHVSNDGTTIILFFDWCCERAQGLAVACAINLGMATCSLLRGRLPLHAASAEKDGRLIAISAPSGTGKTTTLWHLLDGGARLCSDDMTTLHFEDGNPVAFPSQTQHAKLSLEALEMRNLDVEDYVETVPNSEEYWIPVDTQCRMTQPRTLDALFILSPSLYLSSTGHILSERLIGAKALPFLWDNMQGLWPVTGKINRRQFGQDCLDLANRVPTYLLRYDRSYKNLPHLADLMWQMSQKL